MMWLYPLGMPHAEGPFSQTRFDHRQHVKFAWSAVRELGCTGAESLVSEEIYAFAAERAPGKYHQTMTSFWVHLVAHTLEVDDSYDFENHIAQFPMLLDKATCSKHYSTDLLNSSDARKRFIAPDLAPMP